MTGCKDMISIVVPIYNGEKYIEDCIRSILLQTYQDWELILIDNASEDDSLGMCKEYARQDDRIEVLHQHRNVGVSAARNLGIEKARGEYITFVDVDDWITQDYLERLLYLLKEKKSDMVICKYTKVYDADRKQVEQKSTIGPNDKIQGVIYNTKDYLENYFLNGNTHCWGVLYDRNLLDGINFPKGISIGEDMLFLLEVAEKAQSIVVTEYKGYFYYINESGAMKKKFTASYMDQITCWEKALQKVREMYPHLIAKVESILVVSVLLVVGKLAELDKKDRIAYKEQEAKCYAIFMEYAQKKEIRKYLPSGYPLKVCMYRFFPQVYISLYGRLKGR